MVSPIESLENTVRRLEQSLSPSGYHATQVMDAQVALNEAIEDREQSQESLNEWSAILSTLKDNLEVLEQAKIQLAHKAASQS